MTSRYGVARGNLYEVFTRRTLSSASPDWFVTSGVDHPGSDGGSGGLVDQDERTGRAVGRVVVAQQGLGGPQRHPADLVETELGGVLVPVQGFDLQAVMDIIHH